MSQNQEMQKLIRHYRDVTGNPSVDMKAVVAWAVDTMGYPLPEPKDPREQLVRRFSQAAREETRTDPETGEPYRVNHMYVVTDENRDQLHLWIDIDEADRTPMEASKTMRREQIVGDITQLTFDMDHWNRINPDQEPITVEKDFTLDVELRRIARGMAEAGSDY